MMEDILVCTLIVTLVHAAYCTSNMYLSWVNYPVKNNCMIVWYCISTTSVIADMAFTINVFRVLSYIFSWENATYVLFYSNLLFTIPTVIAMSAWNMAYIRFRCHLERQLPIDIDITVMNAIYFIFCLIMLYPELSRPPFMQPTTEIEGAGEVEV